MRDNVLVGKQITDPFVETPKWIDEIKFSKPVTPNLNIEFDANIINQKHILANNRIVDTGNIRDLKFTFNDKQMQVFAMTALANFLRGYRYKASADVANGVAKITAKFSDNPLEYTFIYRDNDGELKHDDFFQTKIAEMENEYPFNLAGIEDSFEDSKTIDISNPIKVAQKEFDYTVMSRYEIVQRCNNRLAVAKEMIEKHIKEGNIVSVGSNEYASTYDMKYLFPDMREKYVGEVNHSLEFVNNKVAERSYENKSANKLALDAGKILSDTFNVEKVVSANRDNNTLNITSIIVHNNMRDRLSFSFNIKNEKLAKLVYIEDEKLQRYSVAQLLQKFGENDKKVATYLNGGNDRIEGGYVYSLKTVKATLSKFIADKDVKNLVTDWITSNKVTKLNSTTIASKHSLNELVRDANFLDKSEIDKIQKAQARFGNDEKFYSYETKDNDTRNKEAISKMAENKNSIRTFIAKSFINFDVDMLGMDKFIITFKNSENKKRIVSARIVDNKILCKVGSKEVNVNELKNIFKKSSLLSAYTIDKDIDVSKEQKYIIKKRKLVSSLEKIIDAEQAKRFVDSITESMERIDEDTYASEKSIEDVLATYDGEVEPKIYELYLQKSNRMNDSEFVRDYINDGDTRDYIALNEQERKVAEVRNRIGKHLNNFSLTMLGGDNVAINFVSNDGKNRSVVAKVGEDILCRVGEKNIPIEQLANKFKSSELLKNYVSQNKENNLQKVILSKRMFEERLSDFITKDEINHFIDSLVRNNSIVKIADNMYATDGTFEDLLRNSDLKVNKNLRNQNLAQKNKMQGKELNAEYINDNDTRNVEKQLSQSEFKSQFVNALPKHLSCVRFNKIDIQDNHVSCDANIYNSKNGLMITAQFDMKVKNGIISTESEKSLDDMFHLATINQNYNRYHDIETQKNDVIFTKRMLVDKLHKIANINDIDIVIGKWLDNSRIEKIAEDKYASKYTISELISQSNILAYNDMDVKQQYTKARVNANIIPKEYHMQDSDTKSLNQIEDGKTEEYIQKSKEKCIAKIDSLKSKITANRISILKDKVSNAKDYIELNNINSEIERYSR